MAERTAAQSSSPLLILAKCNIVIIYGYVGAALTHHLFFLISLMCQHFTIGWLKVNLPSNEPWIWVRVSLNERIWRKNCNGTNRDWIEDRLDATAQALLSWLCGSHYCPTSPSSVLPIFLEVTSLILSDDWMSFLPANKPKIESPLIRDFEAENAEPTEINCLQD